MSTIGAVERLQAAHVDLQAVDRRDVDVVLPSAHRPQPQPRH